MPNRITDEPSQSQPAASSAERLVPAALDRAAVDRYYQQFIGEYGPVGPTEHALTRQLAQHAAALELAQQVTWAIGREAARRLPELVPITEMCGDSDVIQADMRLAVAAHQAPMQTWEKMAILRSRAFGRVLETLRTLQAQRQLKGGAHEAKPPPGFADEAACEAYLTERLAQGAVACQRCGQRDGYSLTARRAWECAGCHHQQGLRAGTVMACSPLPLLVWFEAIKGLLWRPTLPMAELGQRLGLVRLKTVRRLAQQIRAAMAAENASALLAGLDLYFTRASTGMTPTYRSQAPRAAEQFARPTDRFASDSRPASIDQSGSYPSVP